MEKACSKQYLLQHLLRLLFYLLIFIPNTSKALANPRASNNSAPAVIVFGDSTVDPGNNNYVKTVFKANFAPYGKDFANHVPTGRFSNGRLTPDFIASYIGIKEYIPPYLDPTLSIKELMTGVSFASAGSGFDPLTPKVSNVIGIPKQLEYFKEYKKRLESAIGTKETENHINKALFIVSAGTNDFVINYFTLPIRRKTYSVSGYQQFILQTATQFLQDLFEQGARRILFSALPPMGCLPVVITLFSNHAISERGCLDYFSSVGRQFNQLLQNELNLMQIRLANHGVRIYLTDTYSAVTDMIQGQGRSAFDEVSRGCCGTGYLEASLLCNPKSFLCPDASKYVFWDSIHPTEQNVIGIPKQLEYFKEYKKRLESAIGTKETENHINKALFIVSAGTNDFVINYFTLPIRRKTYSVSGYQQFILQTATQFLQDLFEQGARRILFSALPPMGCLPVVITLFSNHAISERGCLDYFSSVGRQFNQLLQNELNLMQIRLANHGVRIYLTDTYSAVTDMIQGQGRSAFDEVSRGCCGTGYLEASLLCNPKSFLCPDASKYVFWDSIHPTEQVYSNVFKSNRPIIDAIIKG